MTIKIKSIFKFQLTIWRSKMKKQKLNIVFYLMLFTLFYLSYNIYGHSPETNNGLITQPKYELMMKNYMNCLKDGNHGVQMSAVEIVGRFKMSYFENTLIEMLKNEKNEKDKEMIALSLFQLGSLNSISVLQNSLKTTSDVKYGTFLSNLLKKYNEYDKLRTEYFEDSVATISGAK